jgi:hypothetical protein
MADSGRKFCARLVLRMNKFCARKFYSIFFLINLNHRLRSLFALIALAEPVSTHAVACPLGLTHPAPLESTECSGADHVHAPAGPLCWRSTLGARLGGHLDGDFRRFFPASFGDSAWIYRVLACAGVVDCWRVGKALADVIALATVLAENKLEKN